MANNSNLKLCDCGCGKITPIAPETRPKRGWFKGQPMPYYPHHSKNRWIPSDGITKQCRDCGEIKEVHFFYKSNTRGDGFSASCKECSKVRTYSYRTTTKGMIRTVVARQKNRLKKFSLTPEKFDAMLASQDYKCAICFQPETSTFKGKVRTLAIDHCHVTGAVRALLCGACNQAIGKLGEDPERMRRAADYIERFKREN